ncbi:MAG TPA: S8 family peptidase, partial [Pyrinomonadaceae bacterium]
MQPTRRPSSTPSARLLYLVLVYALGLQPFLLPSWRASARGPERAAPAAAPAAASPANPARTPPERREGELLVRFRQGASADEVLAAPALKGMRRAGILRGKSRVERLSIDAGHDVEAAVAELRGHPSVEFAEPNFVIKGEQLTPDDPRFAEQWALRNAGEANGTSAGSDVRAARAWAVSTGSPSTVVAVVDSGVDFSHPDLKDNRWANAAEQDNRRDDDRDGYVNDLYGWDFVNDSGTVADENGHGTAVAGLIAARGNNGVGVSGVMWQAGLMSLRVLDATGAGDVGRAVEAIDYAVAHGAQVINCSWGTGANSEALRDAVSRAGARGVVVVAAAGNAGHDNDAAPHYPASFDLPNVISVASTDGADRLAGWSNWGAARVQVAAPGDGVLTTTRGGGYGVVNGTSASAAVVSGVVGLVKTARPLLRAERVREAVAGGVRKIPELAGKVSAGGVVDAAAALGTAQGWPHDSEFEVAPGEEPPQENNGNGKGAGNGGNGNNGNAEPGPPPRPGRPRQSLPNLDEMRRKLASDPIPRPAPARSKLPDYVRGEPTQVPGETISADWV